MAVDQTYPMDFGFKKHQLLQGQFKYQIKTCGDIFKCDNTEFIELYETISQIMNQYSCSYHNKVIVAGEQMVNDRRVDLMLYVPHRICIVVELKTHLAKELKLQHVLSGLNKFYELCNNVAKRTSINNDYLWIPQ